MCRLEAYTGRYFTNLARLIVDLARCPLLRVDSDLDRRLDGAHDLDTIVHAVARGANTPPASWDNEMEILRGGVRYHRDKLRECEALLLISIAKRSHCVLFSPPTAVDKTRTFREDRDAASGQAAMAAVMLQKSTDIIDHLMARGKGYDAKIKEARATIRNDHL